MFKWLRFMLFGRKYICTDLSTGEDMSVRTTLRILGEDMLITKLEYQDKKTGKWLSWKKYKELK